MIAKRVRIQIASLQYISKPMRLRKIGKPTLSERAGLSLFEIDALLSRCEKEEPHEVADELESYMLCNEV